MIIANELHDLRNKIDGDLFTDNTYKTIYATDASAYKEKPIGVLLAKNKEDLRKAVAFANKTGICIIPRTAGTSIAGQVVGNGLVVDVSKYMNQILELNVKEKWVRVQPGVVLDELNKFLKPHGLFFGPETSTSNRCMIGGMVGNNSCGAHSLIYGSTRDHTLEIKAILSDGVEVIFGEINKETYNAKCVFKSLEGDIYRFLKVKLDNASVQENIRKEFPDPELKRRNTGYAIDQLIEAEPFKPNGESFNMCKLLAGSEGTLTLTTEIKLNLVELPPTEKGLLVVHHYSFHESFLANQTALKYNPGAIELIDKYILDCTKTSLEHNDKRFFLEGDPQALLCVEFARDTQKEIIDVCNALINELKSEGMGYAYPILFGSDISKVWALRKAGLGLLSNVPGDAKPQPVIEDTAVSPKVLPDYIKDFNKSLEKRGLQCVYYAHIATGELHLRPVINLKTKEGVEQFRGIATDIAHLVKKYKGSLSGEHGDGRLRGEFLEYMVGEDNYQLMRELKQVWDPKGIFNAGKIVDTPPMDTFLRNIPEKPTPEFETMLDFSDVQGIVRMAEKCNGSGDCRKSSIIGGTMCPTYQATRDEDKTTRARANMLREVLNGELSDNPFLDKDLYDILDLCISCKGCKRECPSGVDMAKLKTEFLYQYQKSHGTKYRSRLIANFSKMQSIASKVSFIYNSFITSPLTANVIKSTIGFAKERSLPKVYKTTFRKWAKSYIEINKVDSLKKELVFFIDEFTNYNDVPIGKAAIQLLTKLGYQVKLTNHTESGRSYISKGILDKAKELATFNVLHLSLQVSEKIPMVGVEPSAILTFRDEYPDLLRGEEKQKARILAENVFTVEEFIANEILSGNIKEDQFTDGKQKILYHGHCQQKALNGTAKTIKLLGLPKNYQVEEIASGCCGMAGSFGYEKEHYNLSMSIAELVLLPKVREASENVIICASGTSCRHQIKDGTGRIAKHPVEVLWEAMKIEE